MLWALGAISAKAETFVGQLVLNYHDRDRDLVYQYALYTNKKLIPLTFFMNDFKRTLNRFSGDVLVVEGEVARRASSRPPEGFPRGVGGRGSEVESSTDLITGMDVRQFSIPVMQYEFTGSIELKYVPELQTSVFLIKDSNGVTRTIHLSKFEQERFIEEYFEQQVYVRCRAAWINGEEVLFASLIERI